MEMFANAAGIKMFHVPYQGGGPVIARLREAVRAAVTDPAFKGVMDKVQTPISYLDAPEFRGFLAKDAARLKIAVEKTGKVSEK